MPAIPDWATAHGDPLFEAVIRSTPSEFIVTEQSDIAFSGEGEHDYLWIEKTGSNTQWVAEQLARHAAVPQRDVGYAGLKDRHAVTRQWFSVRRLGETDWKNFIQDGVQILDQQRHRRKLRRGAHQGNMFRIALRAAGLEPRRDEIGQRLAAISRDGVPNYFGEQRFGRNGSNVDLFQRVFAGQRLSRAKRGIAFSAARSLVFNAILDARVRSDSWDRILPGELANLDGSGSVFEVDEVSDELVTRCKEQDIHPSGTLWGDGAPRGQLQVAAIETAISEDMQSVCDGIIAARMDAASRALRMRVTNLEWDFEPDTLWLGFELAKGGYATAVLRELARAVSGLTQ
ncbi:MAG: tRNA pseudouridine(13) synthase TruD [Woeseiaceae bacterium]